MDPALLRVDFDCTEPVNAYAMRANDSLKKIERIPGAINALRDLLTPHETPQPLEDGQAQVIIDAVGSIRDSLKRAHDTAFERIVCERIVSKIKFLESRGERPDNDHRDDKRSEHLAEYLRVVRGGSMTHHFLGDFMKEPVSSDMWNSYGFRTDPGIKKLAQVRATARKAAALAIARQNVRVFESFSEDLRRDRDIVLASCQQNFCNLDFTPLKADPEICHESIKNHFLYQTVHSDDYMMMNEDGMDDQDIVSAIRWRKQKDQGSKAEMPFAAALAMVRTNGLLLVYLGENMRDNKAVVLTAVRKNGRALPFASRRLQADPEIKKAAHGFDIRKMAAIAMVQQIGMFLKDLSEDLRDDRDVVLQALWQDSGALPFASPRLQADPEIIRAAVVGDVKKSVIERIQKDGLFLQYVVEELKDDEDVVLAAVRQNGEALPFASPRLQADPEIMKAAQESLHQ